MLKQEHSRFLSKNQKRYSYEKEVIRAFLSFLLCVVLVLLITVVNFYYFMNHHFVSYCEEIVNQAGQQIESVLHKMEVSQNQVLWHFCDSQLYDNRTIDMQTFCAGKELMDSLANVRRNNDDIENIHTYLLRYDTLYSALPLNDRRTMQERLKSCLNSPQKIEYEVVLDAKTNTVESIDFFAYVSALSKEREKCAIFCLELKASSVYDALDDIRLDDSQQIYILDQEGLFLYDQECRYTGKYLGEINEELGLSPNARTRTDLWKNEIVVSYSIEPMNWNLIVTFDYLSLFWSMAGESLQLLIGCSAGAVLVIVFMAVRKSGKLAGPIKEIVEYLEHYPGNGSVLMNIHTDNKDIAALVDSYNRMIRKIEALHTANLREEKARLDTEYKALLSQINPHFLFNSLECLRGTAMQYHVPALSDTINALSLMLRYSLDDTGDSVLLCEEVRNLENFLMVIRSRLDYTIGISFDLEDKAMSCRVIKFLLQPVVENSIRYGFGTRTEENQIQISAKMQADTLHLCVYDNGEGIPESLLETLNCVLDAGGEYVGSAYAKGTGIGLSNIAKRLRYTFGKQASLRIESTLGKGTSVFVTISYQDVMENDVPHQ